MQPVVNVSSSTAVAAIDKVAAAVKGTTELPPLDLHHVVLGRYLGSKTKPLNEATRIYRDVRKTTKRTKHFQSHEIAALQQFLSKRVRTELKRPDLPDVTFVVDICKAKDAGKLDYLLDHQCPIVGKTILECGNQQVTFIADRDDHFLKADLDSKKRPGKATASSDCSLPKKRKQAPATEDCPRLTSPLQSMDSSGRCGSLKSGAPSVITTTTIKTDTSSLSSTTNKSSAATAAPAVPVTTTTKSERFQLQASSTTTLSLDDVEEQAHQICEDWIREEQPGNGLESMLRKASLVQSWQLYCSHYKRRFQHDPFAESPISALRELNSTHFVSILNTMGNCMVQWYDQYPSTCLEGEANAWNGDIPPFSSDADMEQGSIGTYSSLELEVPSTLCTDDGVSDIVQCFEEFSFSTGQPPIIRNEWSPVVRGNAYEWSPVVREQLQEENNSTAANPKPQLPPRWKNKSRPLFQKRQQGHQFLQKQLRRFRTKKSSSSNNKKPPNKAAVRECSVRVSTKEEMSLLYRRLRHNDPALKEAIVDFAMAQQEAKELIRVLGLSFYDWDMRSKEEAGRNNAYIVLKRSENSDWEDASK